LLRPLLHRLRGEGWSVLLVAPARTATLLVGTGAAAADELLAWDGPELGALVGGAATDPATEQRLRRCEAALSLSRSAALRRALEQRIPRVLFREPLPPGNAQLHAAAWALHAAAPLVSSQTRAALPDLEPGPEAERQAVGILARLPRGFLALHPGSGSPRKNWPGDRFAELARRLARDTRWLLVVGPADADAAATLAGAPGAVLARELPLRTLAAVLRSAGLFVGNDSGVSHLAAAAGTPTLALYGPTPAAVWSPVGRRVAVLEGRGGDVASLDAGSVEAAARRLWSRES
jgi:hypothetical protein